MNLWRTKTVEQSIADTEEPTHQLRKWLGPVEPTLFGVKVVIGTGIFVLTGKVAGVQAGPRHRALLRVRGNRLRPGGLLRGAGEHGAGGRLGLHLLLRRAR